jgi:hypothetical protein
VYSVGSARIAGAGVVPRRIIASAIRSIASDWSFVLDVPITAICASWSSTMARPGAASAPRMSRGIPSRA